MEEATEAYPLLHMLSVTLPVPEGTRAATHLASYVICSHRLMAFLLSSGHVTPLPNNGSGHLMHLDARSLRPRVVWYFVGWLRPTRYRATTRINALLRRRIAVT